MCRPPTGADFLLLTSSFVFARALSLSSSRYRPLHAHARCGLYARRLAFERGRVAQVTSVVLRSRSPPRAGARSATRSRPCPRRCRCLVRRRRRHRRRRPGARTSLPPAAPWRGPLLVRHAVARCSARHALRGTPFAPFAGAARKLRAARAVRAAQAAWAARAERAARAARSARRERRRPTIRLTRCLSGSGSNAR